MAKRPATPFSRKAPLDIDQPIDVTKEVRQDSMQLFTNSNKSQKDHTSTIPEAPSPSQQDNDDNPQIKNKTSTFSRISLASGHSLHGKSPSERHEYWDNLQSYRSTPAVPNSSTTPLALHCAAISSPSPINIAASSTLAHAPSRIPVLVNSPSTPVATSALRHAKLKAKGQDIVRKVAGVTAQGQEIAKKAVDVVFCGKFHHEVSHQDLKPNPDALVKTQRKYATLPSRRMPWKTTTTEIPEVRRSPVRRHSLTPTVPSEVDQGLEEKILLPAREPLRFSRVIPSRYVIPRKPVPTRGQIPKTIVGNDSTNARGSASPSSLPSTLAIDQSSFTFHHPVRLSTTIRRAPDSILSASSASLPLPSPSPSLLATALKHAHRQTLSISPSTSSFETRIRNTRLEDLERLPRDAIGHVRGLLNALDVDGGMVGDGGSVEKMSKDGTVEHEDGNGGRMSAGDMVHAARTQTPDETERMVKKRFEELNSEVEKEEWEYIEERKKRVQASRSAGKKCVKRVWWLDEHSQSEPSKTSKDCEDAISTTEHFAEVPQAPSWDEPAKGSSVQDTGTPHSANTVEYHTYSPAPPSFSGHQDAGHTNVTQAVVDELVTDGDETLGARREKVKWAVGWEMPLGVPREQL